MNRRAMVDVWSRYDKEGYLPTGGPRTHRAAAPDAHAGLNRSPSDIDHAFRGQRRCEKPNADLAPAGNRTRDPCTLRESCGCNWKIKT